MSNFHGGLTRAKRVFTEDQRKRNAEYLRLYRKAHPDKCRAWRDAYILRRADRLRAAQTGEGVTNGRD